MRLVLSLSLILFSFSLNNAAFAGDIYQCGTPTDAVLDTQTEGVCDIYSRQLEYRIKANEFRDLIAQRQKNFQAPAREARKQYAENLAKLNEERGTVKKETGME